MLWSPNLSSNIGVAIFGLHLSSLANLGKTLLYIFCSYWKAHWKWFHYRVKGKKNKRKNQAHTHPLPFSVRNYHLRNFKIFYLWYIKIVICFSVFISHLYCCGGSSICWIMQYVLGLISFRRLCFPFSCPVKVVSYVQKK